MEFCVNNLNFFRYCLSLSTLHYYKNYRRNVYVTVSELSLNPNMSKEVPRTSASQVW
jgi:hypothetical protein